MSSYICHEFHSIRNYKKYGSTIDVTFCIIKDYTHKSVNNNRMIYTMTKKKKKKRTQTKFHKTYNWVYTQPAHTQPHLEIGGAYLLQYIDKYSIWLMYLHDPRIRPFLFSQHTHSAQQLRIEWNEWNVESVLSSSVCIELIHVMTAPIFTAAAACLPLLLMAAMCTRNIFSKMLQMRMKVYSRSSRE